MRHLTALRLGVANPTKETNLLINLSQEYRMSCDWRPRPVFMMSACQTVPRCEEVCHLIIEHVMTRHVELRYKSMNEVTINM